MGCHPAHRARRRFPEKSCNLADVDDNPIKYEPRLVHPCTRSNARAVATLGVLEKTDSVAKSRETLRENGQRRVIGMCVLCRSRFFCSTTVALWSTIFSDTTY